MNLALNSTCPSIIPTLYLYAESIFILFLRSKEIYTTLVGPSPAPGS